MKDAALDEKAGHGRHIIRRQLVMCGSSGKHRLGFTGHVTMKESRHVFLYNTLGNDDVLLLCGFK